MHIYIFYVLANVEEKELHKKGEKPICLWACCLDRYNNVICASVRFRGAFVFWFFFFCSFYSLLGKKYLQNRYPNIAQPNFFGGITTRWFNALDSFRWNNSRAFERISHLAAKSPCSVLSILRQQIELLLCIQWSFEANRDKHNWNCIHHLFAFFLRSPKNNKLKQMDFELNFINLFTL